MIKEMTINPLQNRFEELYVQLRKKEGRIYSDAEVKELPSIDRLHRYYSEWQVRKRSAARLINYLENKQKPLLILEVGCGNGWLSRRLAGIKNSLVTGTDINKTELEQAATVFSKIQNISFVEGDIRNLRFTDKFDVIVFAASIQYFEYIEEIIQAALWLLQDDGEIHVIDSYFYAATEVTIAKERSLAYYRSMGFEEMTDLYAHHTIDQLKEFNYKLLFNPNSIKNKFLGKKDPFPWICITK